MSHTSIKDGAIQLTYVDGVTALLTVRGKDHDLGVSDLRKLATAANTMARCIARRAKS